jgi:hypothetical protein
MGFGLVKIQVRGTPSTSFGAVSARRAQVTVFQKAASTR